MSIKTIPINILIVTSFAILIVINIFQGSSTETLEGFPPTTYVTASLYNQTRAKLNKLKKTMIVNDVNKHCFCGRNTLHNQFGSFNHFWSYSKIEQYLKHIANAYPKRAKLKVLGRTYENRSLYLMKIGVEMDGNNIVFIHAGMHAKEWNSIMMALYIIHALVECDLYENIGLIDWMIMPVVNPDGYEYSFTHPKHRMWVKNRKPCEITNGNKCQHGQDCGVNIDKNFQFMFFASAGSSRNPCSDFYPGINEGSECESKISMQILYSVKRRIKLYIGLRTYGSLIVYPYAAGAEVFVDNAQEVIELAKLGVDAINKHNSSDQRYAFGSYATMIVPETGTALDYTKGTLEVKYAYYIHLRGLHQPANNEILPILSECFYGICAMVQFIYDKYPPPKKFLRAWKGMRRRRGRRNASENNVFSCFTFGAAFGIYYYVGR